MGRESLSDMFLTPVCLVTIEPFIVYPQEHGKVNVPTGKETSVVACIPSLVPPVLW